MDTELNFRSVFFYCRLLDFQTWLLISFLNAFNASDSETLERLLVLQMTEFASFVYGSFSF